MPDANDAALSLSLGNFEKPVSSRLDYWRTHRFLTRLWDKDPALWAAGPVPEMANRLGWLELPRAMAGRTASITAFAGEIKADGFRHVVLLGMGGSSLGPDVFQKTFGNAPGYPEMIVLDSTHPAAVAAVEKRIDVRRTLFVVSSKSGTTIEPLSFFRYFWAGAGRAVPEPGRHFIAVTDPGSFLSQQANERKFRRVFLADPNVGGRFSAFTEFGLVPAALVGLDIGRLLERARTEADRHSPAARMDAAPGLRLGAAIGEIGRRRDKLTLLTSPRLRSFPDWLEQLIAESLGKDGRGVLPIAGEPSIPPADYGSDRFFAALLLDGDDNAELENRLDTIDKNGFPVIRIRLADVYDLGREIYRWEIATTAAATVLGVHPFNQPDVELAKDLARKAMAGAPGAKAAAPADDAIAAVDAPEALADFLAKAKPGDYVAIQAYLDPDANTERALDELRRTILEKTRLATTLGFGPRFLHSTGQYHKGGPNEGLFLQFVDDPAADLPVPETDFSFGNLIRAQAAGDAQALRKNARRVLRIKLGRNSLEGINNLVESIDISQTLHHSRAPHG
jgi:transaldolase/glucose-6-phosphate isomerase